MATGDGQPVGAGDVCGELVVATPSFISRWARVAESEPRQRQPLTGETGSQGGILHDKEGLPCNVEWPAVGRARLSARRRHGGPSPPWCAGVRFERCAQPLGSSAQPIMRRSVIPERSCHSGVASDGVVEEVLVRRSRAALRSDTPCRERAR